MGPADNAPRAMPLRQWKDGRADRRRIASGRRLSIAKRDEIPVGQRTTKQDVTDGAAH